MNNSLILAKGRSARLSRRRRWGFRPSRGKPAARARVRARLIGGKLTSKISVAENCHWPAGGGLGAGRQVDIEVNLVRPSHGRSPGASSDRGDELSRVYLVIGRVVPFDFLPQPVTHARAVPTRGRNSPAASTS